MIEIIDDLPDHVIGIIAKGRVTNAQCTDVLRAAMHEPDGRCNKLSLYYEIGGRFPGAGWDDLNISSRTCRLPQWERVAIVTDVGWVRHTVNALRFLIAGEIRVFTISQADEGRDWISTPPVAARGISDHDAGNSASPRSHDWLVLPPQRQ